MGEEGGEIVCACSIFLPLAVSPHNFVLAKNKASSRSDIS